MSKTPAKYRAVLQVTKKGELAEDETRVIVEFPMVADDAASILRTAAHYLDNNPQTEVKKITVEPYDPDQPVPSKIMTVEKLPLDK